MITALLWALLVIAILLIVWWALNAQNFPQNVKVVIMAILLIIGLIVLVRALLPLAGFNL